MGFWHLIKEVHASTPDIDKAVIFCAAFFSAGGLMLDNTAKFAAILASLATALYVFMKAIGLAIDNYEKYKRLKR